MSSHNRRETIMFMLPNDFEAPPQGMHMKWVIVLIVLSTLLPLSALSQSATSQRAQPTIHTPVYMFRFSDIDSAQPLTSTHLNTLHSNSAPPSQVTESSALSWLERHGWQKVWPRFGMGKDQPLVFAGPKEARYLRLDADDAYYIWTKPFEIGAHQWPILEITWGMERFAEGAALDVYGRSDRPIVVLVSFGPRLTGNNPLLPKVPRGLAFFWGETETVGQSYTCIRPRIGPADIRMLCRYPHIHYIALRQNDAGSVHTEHINLSDHFQRHFPEYWKEHRRMPPVVGISFEAGTTKTRTLSQSRLYTLAFMKNLPPKHGNEELEP